MPQVVVENKDRHARYSENAVRLWLSRISPVVSGREMKGRNLGLFNQELIQEIFGIGGFDVTRPGQEIYIFL